MKKIICSIIILLCCGQFVIFADDCSDALTEAKTLYNSGDYAKAKSLFEYVKSECGSSYGDATNWITKCNDALTPKLSLSRTSVSVDASAGSTTITVTSNRNWVLKNISSNMFSVSKSGNTITIQYYANSSTNSRNDYFDVATADDSKSVRVYVYQSGKTASPSLSVSKTSISANGSGTTEYITVTCNTAWEIQYPSGTMYSVTRSAIFADKCVAVFFIGAGFLLTAGKPFSARCLQKDSPVFASGICISKLRTSRVLIS